MGIYGGGLDERAVIVIFLAPVDLLLARFYAVKYENCFLEESAALKVSVFVM